MLKYLATIQNPPSLTWLAMIEPADTAITISAICAWRVAAACDRAAAMMPAVVTMATVAEPWASRSAQLIR